MTLVTAKELQLGLPHVLAAPKNDAPIEMLCFREDFGLRAFPNILTLTRAGGIPGERWSKHPWLKLPDGRPDPRIQVSILPKRVLDLVWRDRVGTVHPGDTIVADLDMTHANLPNGTLLEIGTAVLRVSDEPNNGCVKWKARYGEAAMDWIIAPEHADLRLRGVLCSIEQDGEIRRTDPIVVLR